MHNEYVAPFSQEQMSDETMTELQQLRAENSASQSYNPNEDTNARELGGDGAFDVPIGSGLLPFSFILLLYMLRKAIQSKKCSKIR